MHQPIEWVDWFVVAVQGPSAELILGPFDTRAAAKAELPGARAFLCADSNRYREAVWGTDAIPVALWWEERDKVIREP